MRKPFLALLVIGWVCAMVLSAAAAEVETIALFDHAIPETPESIQVDRHGIVYVSLARTGEIRKIDPDDGTQATLTFLTAAPGNLCPNRPGRATIAGIALDRQGNVYVGVNACAAEDHGIWKVTPDGQQSLLVNLPAEARANGIAYHRARHHGKRHGDVLYVADSAIGRVWRLHSDGLSPAEVWSADPLLQHPPTPPSGVPAANGIQVFRDEVYVSVSSRGHIVAFPIHGDGSAGPGRVHVMLGADDFAFDVKGNMYVMTNFAQTVERIARDGTRETLLSGGALDGPSSGAFGVRDDRKNLYIANAAFPTFPGPSPRRPSVLRLHIGIPGEPRP